MRPQCAAWRQAACFPTLQSYVVLNLATDSYHGALHSCMTLKLSAFQRALRCVVLCFLTGTRPSGSTGSVCCTRSRTSVSTCVQGSALQRRCSPGWRGSRVAPLDGGGGGCRSAREGPGLGAHIATRFPSFLSLLRETENRVSW